MSRMEVTGAGREEYLGLEWVKGNGGHGEFVGVLHGWGQLKANNIGWPTFDGKKKSWAHSMAEDDLVAKKKPREDA